MNSSNKRVALHFSLYDPDVSAKAHALAMLSSDDCGKSWLTEGWRNDADAETLGKRIGLVRQSSHDVIEAEAKLAGGFDRVAASKRAMDLVAEGLSVF
jgi:hypothetical protein